MPLIYTKPIFTDVRKNVCSPNHALLARVRWREPTAYSTAVGLHLPIKPILQLATKWKCNPRGFWGRPQKQSTGYERPVLLWVLNKTGRWHRVP